MRSGLMIKAGKMAVLQVALIAAAVTAVHAEPQPLEILRESILSRTTVDFSGTRTVVVFEDGAKVHGVQQRIDCDAPDNLRIVVLAPGDQRGKLCLTAGRDHWEYIPESGRAVHTELPPTEQIVQTRLTELERLAAHMKLDYVGTEPVAGRTAHVVKVYTDAGLPLKKSWVDTRKRIELKTQRFDSHGRVKSSAYYTSINFSPTFEPGLFSFEPPPGVKVVEASRPASRMPLEDAEQKAGFDAVVPGYLPPGYRFCASRASVIDVKGHATIWLSFSNGADTFSLFERPASGEMEATWHDRSVTWHDGGYRFTLMGALTHEEMEKVKASVRP
jgi:outer membrane lipoprotein-sorting protein